MVVYQIYPRSFNDSNGDGIGDINGITEKLDYLKDLGVDAIWLSPCYKSPNEDNGYDISDYRDIMDEFGTLDDWKRMTAEMHKRDIKLIMDFVANHTSSEHEWFKEARKSKDNPYRDYYYWADQPLNDWKACFGGSAWQYDEATDQYYLHSYAVGQPDLNWENPKVRQEMIDVIDYWVDLGVDGFRCDVLDQIAKDFENDKNGNGPQLHKYINMLFGREKVKHIFTVGECWGANTENIKQLIGGDREELSTVFQFDHVNVGAQNGNKFDIVPVDLNDVRDRLIKWQEIYRDNELVGTLFFENHDLPRCITKLAYDPADRYGAATMFATMSYMQMGIPFVFQGQEIGTRNFDSDDISEYRDVETINYYNEMHGKIPEDVLMLGINRSSRDNGRRPIAWTPEKFGGFSTAEPWIPVCKDYEQINVETDMKSEKSVFKYFKQLIALRKSNDVFASGRYENLTGSAKGYYVYSRELNGEKYVIICNFERESPILLDIVGEPVLSNMGRKSASGVYAPFEAAIFKC